MSAERAARAATNWPVGMVEALSTVIGVGQIGYQLLKLACCALYTQVEVETLAELFFHYIDLEGRHGDG